MAAPAWTEGTDGSARTYSERLWPAWWAWLVTPALVSVPAIAYGSAYDAMVGWVIFTSLTALAYAALIASSPKVQVDERVFRAGRARLPRWAIKDVAALDRQELRDELRQGDARAFLSLRTWSTPTAVCVTVGDADDPHPYWLVSTRHPERLAHALREAPGVPTDGVRAE